MGAIVQSLSREQAAILKSLKDLPPLDWYRAHCKTNDQKEHWYDCRSLCLLLQKMLKDYFSGQATNLDDWSLQDREFWFLYRDKWIRFYELIQYGWHQIVKQASKDQISIPATPGEMLIEILEWHAAGMFYPCVKGIPRHMARFSPQKAYRVYQKQQKARHRGDLKTYLEDISREEMYFDAWLNYCLMICNSSKDKTIKSKLRAYQIVEKEVEASASKEFHPRNRVSGHQWLNGRKLPLLSSVKT